MLCKRNMDVISQVEKYFDDDDDFAEAILHHLKREDEWLEKLSPRLRDDKEYVIRWCEMSGNALQYASDRLRNDPMVVLTA